MTGTSISMVWLVQFTCLMSVVLAERGDATIRVPTRTANATSEGAASAAACTRPDDWCFHEGAVFVLRDCDGDGVLDPFCYDGTWSSYIGSASGCRYASAPHSCQAGCPRPAKWCEGGDSVYARRDCDGDGAPDPYCYDKGRSSYVGSSSGCRDTWPDGGCRTGAGAGYVGVPLVRPMVAEGRSAYGAEGIPVGLAGDDGAGDMQPLLDRHNQYRQRHQAPDLSWGWVLAVTAQTWADQCRFAHSGSEFYGESLYYTTGTLDVTTATDTWYNEVKYYDFNNPGWSEKAGHFTQMVWVNTERIGCGAKQCSFGHLLVCHYHPPGNYINQFAENVLPPK